MPPPPQPQQPQTKFFHSFLLYPSITFNTQGPNEVVILVLRAHPITQIPWIINAVLLLLFLVIANLFLPLVLSVNQIIFVNVFGIFLIFGYVWFNFLHWFFNVGIVTNERVIDVDYLGVTYKEVSEARLSKIEDVTAKEGGYIGTLFNYGNVFVQTAGTEINVEFLNIPDAPEVVKIINDLLPA